MKRKFDFKIRFNDIFLLVLGIALAAYDMTVLQQGIKIITHANTSTSSLIALGIALIANTLALDWGIANGRNKAEKIINKKSLLGFLGWVAFGIGYIIIEGILTNYSIIKATKAGESFDWIPQVGQYAILALSYIFSGLIIQKSARDIWDADASACRESKNDFNRISKKLSKDDSKINYMLTALENYNQNYQSLNEEYDKQSDAIQHAEDSVVDGVLLGKTIQENPTITPSEAHKVIEQAKRDFKS